MTHSGGKPHKVGYEGQPYKITVYDDGMGKRRLIGWTALRENPAMCRGLETRPGWTDAKIEPVENKQTGDQEKTDVV